MKEADLALYRAKQDGRNTFRFFEPAMDAALQKRRQLENDLRRALSKKELYLDYQPQFDLESGTLTGYEALVRWWHPTDGDMSPSTFIPIAEETGLIAPLGEWILRTACGYAATWERDLTWPSTFRRRSSRPRISRHSSRRCLPKPDLSRTAWSWKLPKPRFCRIPTRWSRP